MMTSSSLLGTTATTSSRVLVRKVRKVEDTKLCASTAAVPCFVAQILPCLLVVNRTGQLFTLSLSHF